MLILLMVVALVIYFNRHPTAKHQCRRKKEHERWEKIIRKLREERGIDDDFMYKKQ